MGKKIFLRTLFLVGCWGISTTLARAQFTIHDSQVQAAKDWFVGVIISFLGIGLGLPLLVSIGTYWVLRAFDAYHSSRAGQGLWLSCVVWWTGYWLALASNTVSEGSICLLLLLTAGASAAGYFSNRKLKPGEY
jgi:hypothetical protein